LTRAFRIGNLREQILHETADIEASLIVVAPHSCGWFDHILHADAADRVLRQASCPVSIAEIKKGNRNPSVPISVVGGQ
jgi:nucleotide-binding universal stress UspA family protein